MSAYSILCQQSIFTSHFCRLLYLRDVILRFCQSRLYCCSFFEPALAHYTLFFSAGKDKLEITSMLLFTVFYPPKMHNLSRCEQVRALNVSWCFFNIDLMILILAPQLLELLIAYVSGLRWEKEWRQRTGSIKQKMEEPAAFNIRPPHSWGHQWNHTDGPWNKQSAGDLWRLQASKDAPSRGWGHQFWTRSQDGLKW